MKLPTDIADLPAFDWTAPEVMHLTLRDLYDWDRGAAAAAAESGALVVQPASDEVAWEGTELDLRRTVM